MLVVSPLVLLASADCVDCISDIDFSDKKSVISCLVTIGLGIVIRWIEKSKLKRKSKETPDHEEN